MIVYNPPGAERDFTGLDLVFRKRWSNRWQALASYAYSDSEGTTPDDSVFAG